MRHENYDKKLSPLQGEGYFAQLEVGCLSSTLKNQLLKHAAQKQIYTFHVKYNQLKKVIELKTKELPGNTLEKGNQTILLLSPSLDTLLQFMKESKITEKSYYNPTEISGETYIIPKGPLGLKVDKKVPLDLFEIYGNIKISKGMLEILEPMHLLEKGVPVGKGPAKILMTLRKRRKIAKSKVLKTGYYNNYHFRCDSNLFTQIRTEETFMDDKLNSLVPLLKESEKLLHGVTGGSFKYGLLNRTAKLLHCLKSDYESK